MTKAKKILTAQEFLAKKKLIDANRSLVYHSERFGGDILIKDDVDMTELSELTYQEDLSETEKCVRIVYMCCPLFKSAEFREVFDVKEPYDVVREGFKGAGIELFALTKKIMQIYGFLDSELIDDTKK